MKTTVLIHRRNRPQEDAMRVRPLAFSRIPCMGEPAHLGGMIPLMRVLSVIHTPPGDEYQAGITVGLVREIENVKNPTGPDGRLTGYE